MEQIKCYWMKCERSVTKFIRNEKGRLVPTCDVCFRAFKYGCENVSDEFVENKGGKEKLRYGEVELLDGIEEYKKQSPSTYKYLVMFQGDIDCFFWSNQKNIKFKFVKKECHKKAFGFIRMSFSKRLCPLCNPCLRNLKISVKEMTRLMKLVAPGGAEFITVSYSDGIEEYKNQIPNSKLYITPTKYTRYSS